MCGRKLGNVNNLRTVVELLFDVINVSGKPLSSVIFMLTCPTIQTDVIEQEIAWNNQQVQKRIARVQKHKAQVQKHTQVHKHNARVQKHNAQVQKSNQQVQNTYEQAQNDTPVCATYIYYSIGMI